MSELEQELERLRDKVYRQERILEGHIARIDNALERREQQARVDRDNTYNQIHELQGDVRALERRVSDLDSKLSSLDSAMRYI